MLRRWTTINLRLAWSPVGGMPHQANEKAKHKESALLCEEGISIPEAQSSLSVP